MAKDRNLEQLKQKNSEEIEAQKKANLEQWLANVQLIHRNIRLASLEAEIAFIDEMIKDVHTLNKDKLEFRRKQISSQQQWDTTKKNAEMERLRHQQADEEARRLAEAADQAAQLAKQKKVGILRRSLAFILGIVGRAFDLAANTFITLNNSLKQSMMKFGFVKDLAKVAATFISPFVFAFYGFLSFVDLVAIQFEKPEQHKTRTFAAAVGVVAAIIGISLLVTTGPLGAFICFAGMAAVGCWRDFYIQRQLNLRYKAMEQAYIDEEKDLDSRIEFYRSLNLPKEQLDKLLGQFEKERLWLHIEKKAVLADIGEKLFQSRRNLAFNIVSVVGVGLMLGGLFVPPLLIAGAALLTVTAIVNVIDSKSGYKFSRGVAALGKRIKNFFTRNKADTVNEETRKSTMKVTINSHVSEGHISNSEKEIFSKLVDGHVVEHLDILTSNQPPLEAKFEFKPLNFSARPVVKKLPKTDADAELEPESKKDTYTGSKMEHS